MTLAIIEQFVHSTIAFFADEKLVSFVRPGLVFTIQSAQIASDGTISTVFNQRSKGLPLDRDGIARRSFDEFVAAHVDESVTIRSLHDAFRAVLPCPRRNRRPPIPVVPISLG